MSVLGFHTPRENPSRLPLPLFGGRVASGFPSPADDYIEASLDLNELLVHQPAATFFVRNSGNSMVEKGILHGSLLVVNRAKTPVQDSIVVAAVNGAYTCKVFDKRGKCLRPASPDRAYQPIPIQEGVDCVIFGVVTSIISTT